MNLNKKNFFSNLNQNFIFEKKPSIAVGVSGGPDSLALVYLMNKWVKSKKGNIIALIIDHRMRPESYNEAKQIKNYLSTLNIKSKLIRVSGKKLKKRNMSEARKNRYYQLIKFCTKNNILHLFLAHHFDDNIETFLIRKIAGSNIEGLGSMVFSSTRSNIQIIRPMLNYKKEEILNFNHCNKIKFIHDPSNFDDNFTRVKIRKFLLKTNKLKLIKNDFNKINFYLPFYKIMINQILNKIIKKLNKNLISISLKDFHKMNIDIKTKLVEKIYSFLNKKNSKKLRSTKVLTFLTKLEEARFNQYNLSSMNIKKNDKFLDFSLIN